MGILTILCALTACGLAGAQGKHYKIFKNPVIFMKLLFKTEKWTNVYLLYSDFLSIFNCFAEEVKDIYSFKNGSCNLALLLVPRR